jgi:hypothetical protein
LAGSTANLTNELRKFGFNVRTILDPTKAEMKAAISLASAKEYDASSQFILIFNTYVIEEDIITSDSRYGDPATYLTGSDISGFQDWLTSHQHMLFIGNFMNLPQIPQGVNEQNTPSNTISLIHSGVSAGKLGMGINYRPTLEVAVTTPGTMVFSVCIDSYGRVTNAKFNQEKSGQFEYNQVQEVGKNASSWRFDVNPKGQPEQECGEINFVFEYR